MPGPSKSLGSWQLLATRTADAAWNMACDHALAESVGLGESPPALRLFGWDPPAVSVGYNQRLRDVADRLPELRRLGLDLVRRPTGGGAVLHADEVTYSVAAPLWSSLLERGPKAACARIHAAILAGLESLGIAGLSGDAGRSVTALVRARPTRDVCFAATSRSEIAWRGRKLVGSAQRRLGRALLQHGSILLAGDQKALGVLWPGASQTGAANLAEAGGRRFEWEEVAEAVKRGFEQTLGMAFTESPLGRAERRRIDELARERYGLEDFTFRF
jgi:lipoate-protein ligase A